MLQLLWHPRDVVEQPGGAAAPNPTNSPSGSLDPSLNSSIPTPNSSSPSEISSPTSSPPISTGTIVGIAAAAVTLLALLTFALAYRTRRRRQHQTEATLNVLHDSHPNYNNTPDLATIYQNLNILDPSAISAATWRPKSELPGDSVLRSGWATPFSAGGHVEVFELDSRSMPLDMDSPEVGKKSTATTSVPAQGVFQPGVPGIPGGPRSPASTRGRPLPQGSPSLLSSEGTNNYIADGSLDGRGPGAS